MKFIPRICCAALAILGFAFPANRPVVDIDYQKHLKLWRAQRSILTAFEYVDQAERESKRELGPHAQKARELLVQAAKELKIASIDSASQ